jgi:hypothetical protein
MLHRRPPGGSSRSRLRSDMFLIHGCVPSLRFPCLLTLLTLQVGLMAEDTVVGVKHFAEQACAASSVMPVLPAMPAMASLTSGERPGNSC